MYVPAGSKHVATLGARAWIPHRCDHCAHLFAHAARMEGAGTGRSPLWIGQEAARERAVKGAVASLERKLAENADPVFCPACGRLSLAAVAHLQDDLTTSAWAALILGGLASLFFAWLGTGPQAGLLSTLLGWPVLPFLVGAGVAAFHIRKRARIAVDMNPATSGFPAFETVDLSPEDYGRMTAEGPVLVPELPEA